MSDFTVTLADLRKAGACHSGYNKVVRSLQGRPFSEADSNRESYISYAHKELITIESIVASNGLDDALWALCCVQDADRDLRLYAVWCARQIEHLMTDQCSKGALNVVERFANGDATEEELYAAQAATQAAARAAARAAAWDATQAAAQAATQAATQAAAQAAAWAAARAAAWDAAQAATQAATQAAAQAAAWAAAWDAARDAAWAAQKEMLIKVCNGTAPWQGA